MRIIFENDSFLTHNELNNPKSYLTFKIQGMKLIYLGVKITHMFKVWSLCGLNPMGELITLSLGLIFIQFTWNGKSSSHLFLGLIFM
jgi:hypothetical protein